MDRNWRGSRPHTIRHQSAIGALSTAIDPIPRMIFATRISPRVLLYHALPGRLPWVWCWVSGPHHLTRPLPHLHSRPRTRPRSCTCCLVGGWFHFQTASSALVVEGSTIAGSHLEPTRCGVSSDLLLTNQKRILFRSRSLVCGTSGFGRNGLLYRDWFPISGWSHSWLN